eukprot:gnl/TRDRNA2_/TRDRNA2_204747_c0_seq1.p2 gnl/TRDRNA2_/TRDRNA2_204747_c0~~gnl/TRDRNA2_/TRDRNA2_204747_c0_seq1.p2  ORF type:complete len:108 (+),score=1.55 gnl/TRDRNA2_/TRDRNA2_204747_c0_seq1:260-583(+)
MSSGQKAWTPRANRIRCSIRLIESKKHHTCLRLRGRDRALSAFHKLYTFVDSLNHLSACLPNILKSFAPAYKTVENAHAVSERSNALNSHSRRSACLAIAANSLSSD